MYRYRKFLYAVRLAVDLTMVVISWALAAYLSSLHAGAGSFRYVHLSPLSLVLVWVVSSQVTRLYDDSGLRAFGYEVVSTLKNVLIQGLAAAVVVIFVKERSLARLFLLSYPTILLGLVATEKYFVDKFLRNARRHGRNLRTVLIVGGGKVGREFAESIHQNTHWGYKVCGFLDDKRKESLNGRYLGPVSQLENVLSNRRVDNVVIALPNHAFRKVEEVIDTCERFTTNVRIVPDYFHLVSPGYSLTMFDRFPLISLREVKLNEYHWHLFKRGFDLIFSAFLFAAVLWWLLPLIAVFIKLTSPGPVFFKQVREGKSNEKFVVYKFRSMVVGSTDVDDNGDYRQASESDPRITPIGKILRRTNLDEIPQFWNVLKGQMSVVGPRPHPIPLDVKSKRETRKYMQRYLVKPGITGWAQVHGHRGETRDPQAMQKRVDFDLWYIENWSFWLDTKIIFKTVWLMLKGDPKAY